MPARRQLLIDYLPSLRAQPIQWYSCFWRAGDDDHELPQHAPAPGHDHRRCTVFRAAAAGHDRDHWGDALRLFHDHRRRWVAATFGERAGHRPLPRQARRRDRRSASAVADVTARSARRVERVLPGPTAKAHRSIGSTRILNHSFRPEEDPFHLCAEENPRRQRGRRFSPTGKITPQRPDSLADDAVTGEPVSGRNSLLAVC
jgi:hypothetical protein